MNKTKKIILIIDDEESYRDIFANKLQSEGFETLKAKGGSEGLQIALNKKPDLILLDLQMPGVDGMSMLKELRADEWGKDAKVIILTNISDNTKIAEAMEHETFVYLVKSDTSMDELASRVKKSLSLI